LKKLSIIIFTILTICVVNIKAASNIIPDDAIRLRVIANSNTDYDQQIKLKVKDQIQLDLYNLLKDTKGIEEARKIIEENLSNISDTVKKVLEEENYNQDFQINFGQNYFPQKTYKGITYDEGYYESLVITLGSGEGDNWWCVLFPPLCLLEAEESDEVEYKLLISEIIDKYLTHKK
jgi:stage II sporulation protein R